MNEFSVESFALNKKREEWEPVGSKWYPIPKDKDGENSVVCGWSALHVPTRKGLKLSRVLGRRSSSANQTGLGSLAERSDDEFEFPSSVSSNSGVFSLDDGGVFSKSSFEISRRTWNISLFAYSWRMFRFILLFQKREKQFRVNNLGAIKPSQIDYKELYLFLLKI